MKILVFLFLLIVTGCKTIPPSPTRLDKLILAEHSLDSLCTIKLASGDSVSANLIENHLQEIRKRIWEAQYDQRYSNPPRQYPNDHGN